MLFDVKFVFMFWENGKFKMIFVYFKNVFEDEMFNYYKFLG